MDVQDEITAFKERIAKTEKQVKEKQEFPQEDDFYWYVDPTGRALIGEWEGFNIAKDMLEIGNIFKTEEQAEFAAEKLKVEAELRKYSGPASEGSAYIYRLADTNQIGLGVKFYSQSQGTIYFESAEKAKQAIESVGEERIKKYLFGVED